MPAVRAKVSSCSDELIRAIIHPQDVTTTVACVSSHNMVSGLTCQTIGHRYAPSRTMKSNVFWLICLSSTLSTTAME